MKPKYLTFWPVTKVLSFLEKWHPISSLSLKQLTLKTLALLALSSSDRGQTLHLLNIEHTALLDDEIHFVIFNRLKHTSRTTPRPKVVKCPITTNASLNVSDYVVAYMNRTLALRALQVNRGLEKPTQLFLSWATKKPVTKTTIARWLKNILSLAGINSEIYSGHSFRGAGLSDAYSKGVSVEKIVQHGSWTNVRTFKTFYSAPSEDSSVGRIILDQFRESIF